MPTTLTWRAATVTPSFSNAAAVAQRLRSDKRGAGAGEIRIAGGGVRAA
jgi:hypothetical protein